MGQAGARRQHAVAADPLPGVRRPLHACVYIYIYIYIYIHTHTYTYTYIMSFRPKVSAARAGADEKCRVISRAPGSEAEERLPRPRTVLLRVAGAEYRADVEEPVADDGEHHAGPGVPWTARVALGQEVPLGQRDAGEPRPDDVRARAHDPAQGVAQVPRLHRLYYTIQCIYIYIYIYVHISLSLSLSLSLPIYIYIYMCIHTHIYI